MAQSVLTVTVNGQPYEIACAPGQEKTLKRLASVLDERVRGATEVGEALGERQLLVLVGLKLLDEIGEVETRVGAAEAETAALVESVESLAGRIEVVAQRLGDA